MRSIRIPAVRPILVHQVALFRTHFVMQRKIIGRQELRVFYKAEFAVNMHRLSGQMRNGYAASVPYGVDDAAAARFVCEYDSIIPAKQLIALRGMSVADADDAPPVSFPV